MQIKIDVSEMVEFARNMSIADDKLAKAFVTAGNSVSREGADIARSILVSNGSVASGDLRDDISPRPTQISGNTIIMEYGPTSKYPAHWIENGRPPVSARPGGKLKFQIKGRGAVIFAKSVKAAPARPFMRPSVQRLRPIATERFRSAAISTLEGMV